MAGDTAKARKSRRRWEYIVFVSQEILLLLSIVAVVVLLLARPDLAAFTADVQTEELWLTLRPQDPAPEWGLPKWFPLGGEALRDCHPQSFEFAADRPKELTLQIMLGDVPSPKRKMSAAEAQTPLITVYVPPVDYPVARVTCGDGRTVELRSPLTVTYDPADERAGMTLPIAGVVRLGGDLKDVVANASPSHRPLLLSGTLTVEASAWPVRTGSAHSEVPLHLGDVLTFKDPTGRHGSGFAVGLIRTEDGPLTGPALHVIARADGGDAWVEASGLSTATKPIAYAPGMWDRIQAMGVWALIALAAGLGSTALDVWRQHLGTRSLEDLDEGAAGGKNVAKDIYQPHGDDVDHEPLDQSGAE